MTSIGCLCPPGKEVYCNSWRCPRVLNASAEEGTPSKADTAEALLARAKQELHELKEAVYVETQNLCARIAEVERERETNRQECERLTDPWRCVDGHDWDYLFSLIPDGGRGRFWKAVFTEFRAALVKENGDG